MDRRLDVHRGCDIHTVVGDRHGQSIALHRAGNQAARVIVVFFQSFVVKKPLLLGDKNRDLMADVIIAVGNQQRLIESTHRATCLVEVFGVME